MKASIKLGRIYGIEIGLHYSWFIIALLIVLSLSSYFAGANPDWSAEIIWTLAIASALFFFTAIIIHELSHAAVAKANDLPVRSITLFALGGVAQVEKESPDGKTDFWIGIVGPVTSAVIGAVCLGISYLLGWVPMSEPNTPLMAMLVWLGYINLTLAIFNMIPGFPMDGGRVLRGLIWMVTGDGAKATRIASVTGQVMAYGFIVLGLFMFFGGAGFGGLWIAFIGWFLLSAARSTYVNIEMTQSLKGKSVWDVMTREWPTVEGHTNLQTFVDDYLLKTGRRCFVVAEQGRIAGIITPHEVKGIERSRWTLTTLSEVMLPLERLRTITPEMPVTEALALMGSEDVNQLPVVLNGYLKGIISRANIVQLLQTRTELNIR